MRAISVLLCSLLLACGAVGAQAETVAAPLVPVEGNWNATTSAGPPISFQVSPGQVSDARFKFKWGFCGSFESAEPKTVPIEPSGHWLYPDLRGPSIEATFTAPDRAEGTVIAPDRMTPGCPRTEATFTASPGPPAPAPPPVRVTDNINSDHLAKRPHKIVLAADGSFYLYSIRWQSFGDAVATATARAFTSGCATTCPAREVERPRVTLRLNRLVDRGDFRVYAKLHYVLSGPLPPGFAHRGSLPLH